MPTTNKTATIGISQSYTGPDGETVAPPNITKSVPYQAQSVGTIDVPDATAGSTAYSIPFGSIGTEATGFVLENLTGQDMTVNFNGGAAAWTIPDRGVLAYAQPAGGAGTPVTALSVTTTGAQAGAGYVAYRVWGDPVT